MVQSYVGKLEQQNKDLKQQIASANTKGEISSHLEALEVLKNWHNNQKQELEVKFLRKQQTQQVAQIEVKEPKK